MICKKHVTEDGRLLLAVCDSSLKGKKFSSGDLQLDLTGSFYDGVEMKEEEVLELMKKAYTEKSTVCIMLLSIKKSNLITLITC